MRGRAGLCPPPSGRSEGQHESYLSLRARGDGIPAAADHGGSEGAGTSGGEDILTLLLSPAGRGKAVRSADPGPGWPGNENEIRDGEALYDRLVDEGWQGPGGLAGLAFDLGRPPAC